MSTIEPEVARLLELTTTGVLATEAPNGRPRQSLVYFVRDGDRLLISTDAGRRKAADVRRTGWASLAVRTDSPPFPSATLAGPARILTTEIGGPTALVMQRIMGADEPPPARTDKALAEVGRVILAIDIDRVTAVNYVETL